MTYGHLQADCLYTGISSGPNARYWVWEAFTFLPFTTVCGCRGVICTWFICWFWRFFSCFSLFYVIVFLCFWRVIICVLLAWVYCIFLWLFLLILDFCFLSNCHEIGWEEHVRNDLFCVEWGVKPEHNQFYRNLFKWASHKWCETYYNLPNLISTAVSQMCLGLAGPSPALFLHLFQKIQAAQVFLWTDCPCCHPANSVRAPKETLKSTDSN